MKYNIDEVKLRRFLRTFIAQNEQWITIKPHGKDSEDYRRLKIEDGETKDEAVKKFINKENKKDNNAEQEQEKQRQSEVQAKLKNLKDRFTELDKIRTKQWNVYVKYQRNLMWDSNGTYSQKELQELKSDYDKTRDERNALVEEYNKIFDEERKRKKENLDKLVDSINIEKKLKNYNPKEVASKFEELNKKYDFEKISNQRKELIKLSEDKRDEAYKRVQEAKTQEEKDKIQGEWKNWYNDYNNNAENNKIHDQYHNFHRERYKAVSEALKFKNGGDVKIETPKGSKIAHTINSTMELLKGVVASKYLHTSFNAKGKRGRACADSSTMYIEGYDLEPTAIHECMHLLEAQNPEMLANSMAFLRYRTKDDNTKTLRSLTGNKGYRSGEVAKADKFFNPYCGKEYENATEIMSMGVQRLFEHPDIFYNEDREYFNFVIGNLRGEL